jgi:phospholipid transport system substrate-binding protein
MKAMLSTLLFAAWLVSSAAQAETPEDVIRGTVDTIANNLRENREQYRENPQQLRDLIREKLISHTDSTYSARLILGRHGRTASDEQIQRFAKALTDMLVQRYADGLLEFESDDQLEIMPRSDDPSANIVRVRTRIRLDDGTRVPVDYVFRQNDGGWQVFDVVVEGISYVSTFRTQFNREIQRDGLEQTVERLEAGEIDVNTDESA